jgi:predicted Zn-dependent protease
MKLDCGSFVETAQLPETTPMTRRPTVQRRLRPALAAALVLTAGVGACAYNETLGRNQLLLVDESSLIQQSNAAWAEAIRTQPTSRDQSQVARVRAVGDRIVQAAGLTDRRWEYAVFVNDAPNAFVLPSGQIGVTTALLQLVRNDDQLATVIGHEVAHVVARHAAERATSGGVAQLGVAAVQGVAGDYGRQAGGLASIFAQYAGLLPFSRTHELEADRIGVDYMARAGYRASEAVELWRTMAAQRQSGTPEFASTHPSDATRIQQLQQYIAQRGYR